MTRRITAIKAMSPPLRSGQATLTIEAMSKPRIGISAPEYDRGLTSYLLDIRLIHCQH